MTVEKCAKNYCQVSVALNKSRKLPTYGLYTVQYVVSDEFYQQKTKRISSIVNLSLFIYKSTLFCRQFHFQLLLHHSPLISQ